MRDLFERLAEVSDRKFGMNRGPIGALKHLVLEAKEAIARPDDITEYVDCLLLSLDAARRAGFEYEEILAAGHAKVSVIDGREYPKGVPEGEPIEHIRDQVDHPSHYRGKDDPYEAIKVIEAWKLNFSLGSVLKYICRRDAKDSPLLNLKKARWYLDREIANTEDVE